jgi:ribonuclease VapC
VIVDSSAFIAILRGEPSAPELVQALRNARAPLMSTSSYLEVSIAIDRGGDPVLSRRLDEVLHELGITLAPFDAGQAALARSAHDDFGRGSGHPARLNFGDCMTYALAKATGEPLLFVGDDFAATDLHPALPR